ncbi:MAG TPA: hypothetical protein VMT74_03885 [Gaiellaceae bacterium]|nr:hypothetical protein [Gaiellaceae bacterium]
MRVDAHRQAQVRLVRIPPSTGYLCGLHAQVATGNAGAAGCLRRPIVVVRLRR